MMNTPVVILAAGASTRMGESKQQLLINHKTFLERAVDTAKEIGKTIVVLGANADQNINTIKDLSVTITINNNWSAGMGSSLKCGLKELLLQEQRADGMIVMVCDQPNVSSNHLKNLINTQTQTQKEIVASSYKNTIGVPVLFMRSYFNKLSEIPNEEGAKKILKMFENDCALVPLPGGEVDIDTPEDYQRFIQNL